MLKRASISKAKIIAQIVSYGHSEDNMIFPRPLIYCVVRKIFTFEIYKAVWFLQYLSQDMQLRLSPGQSEGVQNRQTTPRVPIQNPSDLKI